MTDFLQHAESALAEYKAAVAGNANTDAARTRFLANVNMIDDAARRERLFADFLAASNAALDSGLGKIDRAARAARDDGQALLDGARSGGEAERNLFFPRVSEFLKGLDAEVEALKGHVETLIDRADEVREAIQDRDLDALIDDASAAKSDIEGLLDALGRFRDRVRS